MKWPLVSVVVPVFNGQPYLADCLASIFAQDYDPFEVIVVDDGSTDGTEQVVRSFSKVRYIRQDNRGSGAARNTGTWAAAGEFVSYFDHDDLMLPEKLKTQMGYLLSHSEVDCVLCRQTALIEPGFLPQASWMFRDQIFGDLMGVQLTSAVARISAIQLVNGFDTSFRVGEDLDLLFRLKAAGITIAVVPQILMQRRLHGANLTIRNNGDTENLLKSLRAVVQNHRRGVPSQRQVGR